LVEYNRIAMIINSYEDVTCYDEIWSDTMDFLHYIASESSYHTKRPRMA
jgi:hypothetical protein